MAIPLWEMKMSKAPIIILKGGDRQLTFYKAKKFGSKYFAIKDPNGGGMVFELDDRYEYRYKNTSIYIYNFSNFKPILLTGLAEIDKKLRSEGKSQLDNIDALLSQFSDAQVKQFGSKIKDPRSGFSPETRRFLEDYSTDDENAKTEILIQLHHQKTPITRYSSQLSGIGMNSGNYAIVQIGHKKLDIVEMQLYENRAYTPYGVFNFTIDNLYLVKKQIMGFFILNDTEDSISKQVPKHVTKTIKTMAKKKQWSFLETFNKPKRTKIEPPTTGYQLRIEKVEPVEDEEVKSKINASIKPIKKSGQKNKKLEDMSDYDNINTNMLERLSTLEPVEEPIEEEFDNEQIIEDDIEEPIIEEEPQEVNFDITQDKTEPTPDSTANSPVILPQTIPESETEEQDQDDYIELELSDATGPPGEK